MLKSLHVHNFALIEDAVIEFTPGFNVFSGETGAGKSILIDALGIVLGNRASTEYIREGADSLWVQAVFDVTGSADLQQLLADQGLEGEDDSLFLRRKVLNTGKSQAMVNGVQVPLAVLHQLCEQLVDIHGQNENQRLLKTGEPLNLVDLYGSAAIDDVLKAYQLIFKEYLSTKQEIEILKTKNSNRERIFESLDWEVKEIEAAQIVSGEDEQLQEELKRLSNRTRIIGAASSAYEMLNGTVSAALGTLDSLNEARTNLASVTAYDIKLLDLYNVLDSAWLSLEDARQSLGTYLDEDNFDPAHLTEVQERLDLLYKLKKKYGPALEDVLEHLVRAKIQLDELALLNEKIEKLEKQLHSLTESLAIKANDLTRIRREKAGIFAKLVTTHIRDLAMPQGDFCADFSEKAEFGMLGRDEVQFLFSANLGQGLKPLFKVASGGELSRVALAIKTVLLEKSGVPTMVFDEIDSGVGGLTAQKMAEKIAIIAGMRQVLCITHLGQIASFADNHLYIEKFVKDSRTVTCIKVLSAKERIEEIMRMTGGSNITEAACLNAEQLLSMAAKTKADLRRAQ